MLVGDRLSILSDLLPRVIFWSYRSSTRPESCREGMEDRQRLSRQRRFLPFSFLFRWHFREFLRGTVHPFSRGKRSGQPKGHGPVIGRKISNSLTPPPPNPHSSRPTFFERRKGDLDGTEQSPILWMATTGWNVGEIEDKMVVVKNERIFRFNTFNMELKNGWEQKWHCNKNAVRKLR